MSPTQPSPNKSPGPSEPPREWERPLDTSRKIGKAHEYFDGHNPLLVTHRLGKSRMSAYTLPDSDFTYGKPSLSDSQTAGNVILNWEEYTPNEGPLSGRDFVKLNKMGIRDHALTPKQITQFRREHNARFRKGVPSRTNTPPPISNLDVPFGVKTKYDTPARDLLENKFQNDWVKEHIHEEAMKREYGDKLARSKRPAHSHLESMRRCRSTSPRSAEQKALLDSFKLKRFQNVPSKLQVPK